MSKNCRKKLKSENKADEIYFRPANNILLFNYSFLLWIYWNMLHNFWDFRLTFFGSKSSERYTESISRWTKEKPDQTQSTSLEPPCSEFSSWAKRNSIPEQRCEQIATPHHEDNRARSYGDRNFHSRNFPPLCSSPVFHPWNIPP